MIPLLTAALLVRATRTLPGRRRDRVALVARPHGVVHVALSPLTRTGRHLPTAAAPVCRTRTRRLTVLQRASGGVDLGGRRVCVRCRTTLARRAPEVPGLVAEPRTRDEWLAAFSNLTPANLAAAVRTARSVSETSEVSHLVELLFADARRHHPRTDRDREVAALRELILTTRARLVAEARTTADIAQISEARTARRRDEQLIRANDRADRALAAAVDRRAAGHFLMPWERAAIGD